MEFGSLDFDTDNDGNNSAERRLRHIKADVADYSPPIVSDAWHQSVLSDKGRIQEVFASKVRIYVPSLFATLRVLLGSDRHVQTYSREYIK